MDWLFILGIIVVSFALGNIFQIILQEERVKNDRIL